MLKMVDFRGNCLGPLAKESSCIMILYKQTLCWCGSVQKTRTFSKTLQNFFYAFLFHWFSPNSCQCYLVDKMEGAACLCSLQRNVFWATLCNWFNLIWVTAWETCAELLPWSDSHPTDQVIHWLSRRTEAGYCVRNSPPQDPACAILISYTSQTST
jgi:hypothetical protein